MSVMVRGMRANILTRVRPRVLFNGGAADAITAPFGLRTAKDQAAFFGMSDTTYSRVRRGVIYPGEEFIAAVLNAVAPQYGFSDLFYVTEE